MFFFARVVSVASVCACCELNLLPKLLNMASVSATFVSSFPRKLELFVLYES